MDDSDVDVIAKRTSKAEYKKFDGWPWGAGGGGGEGGGSRERKKSKRHSLPLTRISLDEAKKGVAEKAFGVFRKEPEPEPSLGPRGVLRNKESNEAVRPT